MTHTPSLVQPTRPSATPASRGWPGISAEPAHEGAGSPWLLTVHGGDRPGIVSSVVSEVARVGGNITDLTTRLPGDLYLLVAELQLPARLDRRRGRGPGRRRHAARGRGRRAVSSNPAVLAWTEAELGVEGRVLDVVTAPAALLAQPGAEVDPTAAATVQLAADLVATMRVLPGCVGLAAPQLAVSAQVFCVDVSAHPRTRDHHGTSVLCNAEVVEASRNEKAREGCMSVPDPNRRREAGDPAGRPRLPGTGEEVTVETNAFEARALGDRTGEHAVPRPRTSL